MNRGRKRVKPVTLRTKGNNAPPRAAGKLAAESSMKALAGMIETGELDRNRTVAYLRQEERP